MNSQAPEAITSQLTQALPEFIHPQPKVVFTDVDDTLTHEGQLPEATFSALHRLERAGITVVPVTGACAGWCDCLIKTWPIRHIIGENGALTLEKHPNGVVSMSSVKDACTNKTDLARLQEVAHDLQQQYPSMQHTQDQSFRLTDIAFDIGQAVTVPDSTAEQATAWLKTQGVQARRSSIHINVWLGTHSKSTTAIQWLAQRALNAADCIFIGDSPNDECMFQQFPLSVGVANVQRFLPTMDSVPTYITKNPGGLGFVDLTDALLK